MVIDYSTPFHYVLALLPETVLAVWALVVLMADVFSQSEQSEGQASSLVPGLTIVGIALAAIANGWLLRFHEADATGMIALDSFRVFTNYLFLLAAALFVLISGRYLEREKLRHGELYVLVLLATVGMMFFAGTRDLMLIFLGLELMSIGVYVLTGMNRRDRRSAEAALKYFLLGAFSSAFFLFGIALVYGGTGSVNLTQIAQVIGQTAGKSSPLLFAGMGMLAVGFGFKVAAVPFHMWTPDVYEGAPSPVTAFMAAAVKAAAFAAFLRVFLTAFHGLYTTWAVVVFWLAIATMVVANLTALAETNVKRMLAYSSIAHAGYLLVALTAGTTMGAASFLFYLVAYTLMTMGAFAVVLVVGREGELNQDVHWYSGLGWEKPLLGVTMTIFLLSLAGVPATAGFIGKFFIIRAAMERGFIILPVVLVLASLVSYWYYLRVAWYMWFRPSEEGSGIASITVPGGVRVALVTTAVLVLVFGILPGLLLTAAEHSAATLTATAGALAGLGRP
ncbi:MAG TPA: NADH-quinone oxidoreductase subunit N [Longimicrobiales bacterium]|nr:NADH-quinone oxidoreductase subunit N [Longimicrobiales bacterium]